MLRKKPIVLGICILLFCVFLMNNKDNAANQVNFDAARLDKETKAGQAQSVNVQPKKKKTYHASLIFTGDLMVHNEQLSDAYQPKSKEYSFYQSFRNVSKYLSQADYTIGNLETTFAGAKRGYSGYPMFSSPDSFGYALKRAGFDFLTTANNHSNDKGEKGILRTIRVLNQLKIAHTGTFQSRAHRNQVQIKRIKGMTFAFLSYTYGTNGLPTTKGKSYLVNYMEHRLIKRDILRAKKLNPDFIVILPHMGNEYEQYPKKVFKDWINFMLSCGADIVMASHPHVVQPAEFRIIRDKDGTKRKCFVAYSMGNFISSQRTVPRDAGAIFKLSFVKKEGEKARIHSASFIPTWVQFYDQNHTYRVRVLPVYHTLKRLKNISLRVKDINRLKKVIPETVKTISGKTIQASNIRRQYMIR